MVKPEWGTKRTCLSCSAIFYDLNKTPPVCPKCGAAYEVFSLGKGKKGKSKKDISSHEEVDGLLNDDEDIAVDEEILMDDDDDFNNFSAESKDDEE